MAERRANLVIVGGGVSGLALGLRLRQKRGNTPDDLVVLEAAERPGGTAWSERHEGFLVEWGPNGFLSDRHALYDLCVDAGLGDRLLEADPASFDRYLCLNQRLVRVPSSLAGFLFWNELSISGRLRTLAEWRAPTRATDEDESIADFGSRRLGRETSQLLLESFVTGVFAGDPSVLSAPASFPKLVEMERTRGSLTKGLLFPQREARRAKTGKRRFIAPREGMGELSRALALKLEKSIHLNSAVTAIQPVEGGWRVETANDRWIARAVALACPAYVQARFVQSWNPTLAHLLEHIPYAGVIVVTQCHQRSDWDSPRAGFGYLKPARAREPILGAQWSSQIFPSHAPEEGVHVRAILGGWSRPDVLEWDDDRLKEEVARELRRTIGLGGVPVKTVVRRWPKGIPQYTLGHRERMRSIDAELEHHPCLFLAGNAFRGIALNDCAEDALRLSAIIDQRLKK